MEFLCEVEKGTAMLQFVRAEELRTFNLSSCRGKDISFPLVLQGGGGEGHVFFIGVAFVAVVNQSTYICKYAGRCLRW